MTLPISLSIKKISLLTSLFVILYCTSLYANESTAISNVLSSDEVEWSYLNPLRGDKSPSAADLWGDRTQNVATGMLVKFNQGFSSPPHIHNISYRGIVIKGLMHNDDPNSASMWMPTGSFWTQPAGDNHITAANGVENLIYLEIDNGPYLVKPSQEYFDNGEVPLNLHQSNLAWLSTNTLAINKGNNVKITPLWQNKDNELLKGVLVKLPLNFEGKISSKSDVFRVVIIQGNIHYKSIENTSTKRLSAGSYFSSLDDFEHIISSSEGATLYIRSNGRYQITDN